MAVYRKETRLGNVYIIDLNQFGLESLTGVYCYYDGERGMLFDTGTSDNVDAIFRSLERHGIPAEKLAGIVPSHYHFDHGGGCSAFWHRMRNINPDFRVYTGILTKEKLQNPGNHIKGASTTFGSFTGTMEYIPDEAFVIVEYESFLPVKFNDGARVKLLHTPGHTHDHCSPSVMINDECIFCFAGETCGTYYTDGRVLTTPSSMPPNFSWKHYMESMEKIRLLDPAMIGFCHFGIITGADEISMVFDDHVNFMNQFRDAVIKAFHEDNSTAHVMERTAYLWEGRFGQALLGAPGSEHFFRNLRLALTYGLMIDLGFRESKYEVRTQY